MSMPENKKIDNLKQALSDGYKTMSSVNLALAEQGLAIDNASLELCEQILAERE